MVISRQQLDRLYESGNPREEAMKRLYGQSELPPVGAGADVYRRLLGGGTNPFAPPQAPAPNMLGPTNDRAAFNARQLADKNRARPNFDRAGGSRGAVRGSGNNAPPMSPYEEFLQGYYSDLAGSYDAQINAIGGLNPLFKQQAADAQQNIGNFFGFARNVANEGIPVTQDIYGTAQENVEGTYDQLSERLQAMPGKLTDVARQAAGGAVGSSVAGRVAAATAPFAAAGETARANAVENLSKHSAAGQNYLNQLASSTGAESALHQSGVEDALNQQLQMIAYRQAEIEGAKQRALAEVSADIAGASSERMANAALASALGINAPEGVDPMDFLRGQSMMQGLQGGEIDQQQAMLNLTRDMNPDWQVDQATQGMSGTTRNTLDMVRRIAETSFEEGDNPENLGLHMMQVLDDMARAFGEENYTGQGTDFEGMLGGREIPVSVGVPAARQQIEAAIRALYGGR